jgi:hypothetical protein
VVIRLAFPAPMGYLFLENLFRWGFEFEMGWGLIFGCF